jgi:hypothetical protein
MDTKKLQQNMMAGICRQSQRGEEKRRAKVVILACSLEIISQISQPASSIFLSQKTSQQYFQPARSAPANKLASLKSFIFPQKIESNSSSKGMKELTIAFEYSFILKSLVT